MKIKAITAGALGAVIGIAGGWGLYAWRSEPPTADELNQRTEATVLPVGYARIPDVTLKTASGDFSRADLGERWTFLFFGFTHCPDVCPTTLQKLSIALDEIRKKSEVNPRVLFVSVDFPRDTPQSANRYAGAFGSAFVGATAAEPVLRQVAEAVNATFSLPDEPLPESYSVQHSSAVFLLDTDGRVRALFGSPQDPEAVARDFLLLREALAQPS